MPLHDAHIPSCDVVQIPGFPGYFADREGQVWSAHRKGKTPRNARSRYLDRSYWSRLKPWRDPQGYLHHTLVPPDERSRERVALHILIAAAFLGARPPGQVVAHLDGNKLNNRPENLVYVSQRENIEHKRRHGTMMCGDRSHMSRLSDLQCLKMLTCLDVGYSRREVASAFGVSIAHVSALKAGRIRKHLIRNRSGILERNNQ